MDAGSEQQNDVQVWDFIAFLPHEKMTLGLEGKYILKIRKGYLNFFVVTRHYSNEIFLYPLGSHPGFMQI